MGGTVFPKRPALSQIWPGDHRLDPCCSFSWSFPSYMSIFNHTWRFWAVLWKWNLSVEPDPVFPNLLACGTLSLCIPVKPHGIMSYELSIWRTVLFKWSLLQGLRKRKYRFLLTFMNYWKLKCMELEEI